MGSDHEDEADSAQHSVPTAITSVPPAHSTKIKRLGQAYWRKKRWTLPLTVLALIGLVVLIPSTRYPVLGLIVKKDFNIVVVDATSKKPITKAVVDLAGVHVQTDASGKAKLRVAIGNKQLQVSKKYYATMTSSVLVPVSQKQAYQVLVKATGRQVPVTVTNKISGAPLAGVLLAAAGTDVKTDTAGTAIIVLPADKTTVDVTLTADGYNSLATKLQISEQVIPQNSFTLTATGKVYFLSKQSGKIDVVKTNLDGSDRQTVLAGNGKENDTDTILLASRDWKYLALKSLRDGGDNAKLFLIDTATDKLTTMDEGNAYFTPVGWSEHRLANPLLRS